MSGSRESIIEQRKNAPARPREGRRWAVRARGARRAGVRAQVVIGVERVFVH